MTGCELSLLILDTDFCTSFCGDGSLYICDAYYYGGCLHEVAHIMYHIAIDMLETA